MFNNSVDTIIEQEKAILSTMTIVERAQRIAMFKAIYGIDLREELTTKRVVKEK